MKTIPVRKIHTTRKEPEFTERFNIRDVREMLAGKDMIQELHRHDFFFILALDKGQGHHVIDFTSYNIHDASVFFMRPGQVHQLVLKAGSTGYLMQFKPDFYHPMDTGSGQLLRYASNKTHCQLDSGRFKKLIDILTYIFHEYSNKQEGHQEVIKANLSIFLIELVRRRHHGKSTSTVATPYTQERLDAFLELLETHIATHKQVSQYADMLNLSAYQLNAITKASLDKTCSELINDFIVLESKRHLLATGEQVNQIAYQLGYEDASYFIRFFKKHTGYTPEAFRNKFR